MAELQRILAIPFKRGPRRPPVEYLEEEAARRSEKTAAF
jgi:hypothetical protein